MEQDAWAQEIRKKFGKESIRRLDSDEHIETETVSTGSVLIDAALGIGGVPLGRIVELYGPEGSGKSTVALHIAANTQKNNGKVLYIDTEHALNLEYARRLGINTEMMFLSQPSSGEEALSIAVKAAEFGKDVKCIIVDSVAALAPEAELAGEIGDQTIGLQARLMSRCMRAITPLLARNNVLLLCINQIRDKIGAAAGYGCVDGDSIIALGNNSQSKIISLKENTKIKSFNCDKQKVEKTECITLLKNGVSGEFHELTYISIFNRDSKKLIITPEHSVFSYGDMQWKKCKELRPYNSFVLSVDSDKVRKKEQLTASFFVEEGQVKAKDNTGIELTMTPYLCARAYLEMKDKAELIKQTLCKILREKLSEYEFSRLVTFVKNLINIEEMGAVPSLVTSNRPIDGERERYDLMVDKNENYFANDLLIHNSPETTPGGRALRFYASVRMEIRRIGAINSRQMDLGSKVRVRILKNKFAAPFKSADTEIYYGKGILKESELLELAEQNRIVERSGSWYSYRGEKLGQGRENIIVLLRTDKKLLKSVEDELAKM